MRHPLFSAPLLFSLGMALAVPRLAAAQEMDMDEARRYGNIGALAGGAIGAVVGGPPGAVATAAFGAWLADTVIIGRHNKQLKAHLETTRQELLALQETNAALQQDYQLALEAGKGSGRLAALGSANSPAGACCSDSEVVLHFRTNSAVVEPHYRSELQRFVSSVTSTPGAVIELQGHADRRGGSSANLALSQKRLQEVERELRALGIGGVIVETTALGATAPVAQARTAEGDFFDRRVVLRLRSNDGELLSSSTKR